MKSLTSILALLAITALASPVPNPDAEAISEPASSLLEKRYESCTLSQTVNCYKSPNSQSAVVERMTQAHRFDCYALGETINGNNAWDKSHSGNCYVNAYYTGSNCNTINLPRC